MVGVEPAIVRIQKAITRGEKIVVYGDFDAQMMYGVEHIDNMDLAGNQDRTNQLAKFELRYRY